MQFKYGMGRKYGFMRMRYVVSFNAEYGFNAVSMRFWVLGDNRVWGRMYGVLGSMRFCGAIGVSRGFQLIPI